MAKPIIFLASTLYIASLVGFAAADADDFDRFHVQGSVYCDTCRVQFITKLTKFLGGAKVKLECKNENGTVVLSSEAVTDSTGAYHMEVMGDHEKEVCEILLMESPDAECNEISKDEYVRNFARVSLTANDGIVSNETRIVNPLGFLRRTQMDGCKDMLKELEIIPDFIF